MEGNGAILKLADLFTFETMAKSYEACYLKVLNCE